ncbi:MAG: heavy-metal-associated domain-containing protein [Gemmataceae bacterium]|nr:heavy-metal-associated domain-containing protein [Gemmataceae bacterium]
MRTQEQWSLAVTAVAALVLGSGLRAADPVPTTITVADLHCAGCAKKVTTKLSEVAGVGVVRSDLERKTVTVTPKAQMLLSPRSLWEAVERAGKQPLKLEGPSGTFTARPQ